MKRSKTFYTIRSMVLAAMFLAIAYVLPFITGQIPQIGMMLCPMHIPVLLCGFICGWPWGLAVGLIAPLLRSATLGVPAMFPQAVCMALELAAYGALSGLLHRAFPAKRGLIYVTLIISMIAGRLVWGAARFICTGLDVTKFGLQAFWSGAVATAIPGIIIQIVIIPPLVMALELAGLGRGRKK